MILKRSSNGEKHQELPLIVPQFICFMIDQFSNTGLTFKYNDSTYTVQIDDKNQNIIGTFDYERYNFDFDSVYRDRNMLFTFDCNQDEFIGTGPHWHTSINNNYLRYGYQFNVAMILY